MPSFSLSRNRSSFSGLVGGDADDVQPGLGEVARRGGEVDGLGGAARGQRRRVAVDDHPPAAVGRRATPALPSASGSVKSGAGSPGDRRTGAVSVPLSVMTGILPCPPTARNGGRGGAAQPARNENRTCRWWLSVLVSTRQIRCQVPSCSRPSSTGTLACGGTNAGSDVVAAVPGAAVPVPPAVVAGEQHVELGEQVVVAAGAGLEDRDPGRRVRHEDVQQPVGLRRGRTRRTRRSGPPPPARRRCGRRAAPIAWGDHAVGAAPGRTGGRAARAGARHYPRPT